jgi:hypothetical protein
VFADARFGGVPSFRGTSFEQAAIFSHARFDDDARFVGASFAAGAFFQGTRFYRSADFGHAHFSRFAHFGMSHFARAARFRAARFDGPADFSEATFEAFADFAECDLGPCAVFLDAGFLGLADFGGARASMVDLGPDKPRIRGWSPIRCGVYHREPFAAKGFWQFALRGYATAAERSKADAAFYFQRLHQWKHLRSVHWPEATRARWGRLRWSLRVLPLALRKISFTLLWLLDVLFLRWTTAYGASIARLLATWFVVMGGFSVIYALVPSARGPGDLAVGTPGAWIDGVHRSVAAFTLGLGPATQGLSGAGKLLTSIEAILGALSIVLAAVVIGRRFTRQS